LTLINDLWPDSCFSANDTAAQPSLHQQRKGGFTERGVLSGIAFSEEGAARAGMGATQRTTTDRVNPSVMITNLCKSNARALSQWKATACYVDEAPPVGRRTRKLATLGFGCFFFDYDLDGWLDIFVANGHIERDIETYSVQDQISRSLLTCSTTPLKGHSQRSRKSLGPAMRQPRVGRGAGLWRLRQ